MLFSIFLNSFDKSVVSGSGLGSDFLASTGVYSKGDIFASDIFYQWESSKKVVESLKGVGAQIPYFNSKFEIEFYSYSLSQTFPLSLQPL